MLKDKQKELGIEPSKEIETNGIVLIKPEEFPKYNLTYPSDLDIIKRGMKTAQHSQAIPTSRTQQPCGDCSDCHEMPGQPDDWFYWTNITKSISGGLKIIETETISLSETFCIDKIVAAQLAYTNGYLQAYAIDTKYDDYLAGTIGSFAYPERYTKYWQVYDNHDFEDIDFINLYEETYASDIH